jgi:uncharacterized protein DUF6178
MSAMDNEIQKSSNQLLNMERLFQLLDDSRGGERINETDLAALSIVERLWLVQRLPLREKANLIISSPDPMLLLKRLSSQEVYLIVRESWGEDAAMILEMATPDKIVRTMDIDIWRKDRINYDRFMEWLELIALGGDRALTKTLFRLDPPLMVLFFKGIIEVISRNFDQDPLEMTDGGYYSIDTMYYFRPINSNLDFEMIIKLLSSFFEVEPEFYKIIMEGIIGQLPSPMEEEAYQLRSSRMAMSGFPEFYEAREILLYKDSETIKREMTDDIDKVILQDENQKRELPPSYWLIQREGGGLIEDLLSEIGNSNEEGTVLWELSYLVHKLVAAQGSDLADTQQILSAVIMAKDYLNLGLDILVNGNRDEGRRALEEFYLQNIFRLGSAFQRLGNVINPAFWGNEANDLFTVLAGRQPFFYGGIEGQSDEYKNFSSMEEINFIERFLDELEIKIDMVSNLVTIPVEIESYLSKNAPVNNWGIETIFLTAFVRRCIAGIWEVIPHSDEDLKKYYTVLKENKAEMIVAKDEVKGEIERLSVDGGAEDRKDIIEEFISDAYQNLESELLAINDWTEIDPRFIACLITVGESSVG